MAVRSAGEPRVKSMKPSCTHHVRQSLVVRMGPGLVLVLIVLVTFWPFLIHPDAFLAPRSGLGTDISIRHWGALTSYARALREHGGFPLWDDSMALGRPLAGDPDAVWLYPFDLIFLVSPPAVAFNILAVVHVLLAGVLAMWFCRMGLQTSRGAALVGGLAFMLTPKFVAHLAGGHIGIAYSFTWLPLAMLGTHLAVARSQWRGSLMAGLALALQFSTFIQVQFYTALLISAYFLWLWLPGVVAALCTSPRAWRPSATQAGTFALAVATFIGLSMAQLLPFLSLMPLNSRNAFTAQDAAWYTLPVPLLATILIPTDFQFPEWTMYVGIVPALLALAGLTGPRRRQAVFFAGLVAFAAIYSIGLATPLFTLVRSLPGFSQLRVPPRIWLLGTFGVASLAALGADAVSAPGWRDWVAKHQRAVRLALASVLAAGISAVGVLAALHLSPLRLVFALVIAAGAVWLLARQYLGRLSRVTLATGLVGLTALDLAPTAHLFTLPVPVESVISSSPALDWLTAQPGQFRVYSPHGELPYAQGAGRGVQTLEGFFGFQMAHTVEVIKLATGCTLSGYTTGIPPCFTAEIDSQAHRWARPDARLLGLLNVKYVLSSLPLDDPDLEPVADWGTQRVYRNRRFLPRVFVVGAALTLADEKAVLAALPGIDPSSVALLASQLPQPLTDEVPLQAAEVVGYRPGYWQISVKRQSPGLLVIAQTWAPGWRATDNGQAARVLRVDYALSGVYLSAGDHLVELVYDPLEWRYGRAVSLASVIGLAIVLALGHVRRSRLGSLPP